MQGKAQEHEREALAEGTLLSHLVELRSRILKALLAVIIAFVCLVPFAQGIFMIVARPLTSVLPGDMIAIRPGGPFLTPFKTTLFVALFIAMPAVLYQIWAFVAPALYRREKRLAFPLLISSIVLFYLGIAFAYYVVFPLMFAFFVSTTPETVTMMTDIGEYLGFVLALFAAFGVSFQVPVATVLLIATGLFDGQTLRRSRPYVLLGAFVAGMLLTPQDVFSQTLLAVPMYLLFEGGLIMARILLPEKMARAPETA